MGVASKQLFWYDVAQTKVLQDPFPLFIDKTVQIILRRITGFDIMKACAQSRSPVRKPEYKILSDEQLQEELKKAEEVARSRLQMPPVMNAREPIDEVLSSNPELEGLHSEKYVFVDISSKVTDKERSIVVRDPDGTLRKASWDERERMNQIFFPQKGRKFFAPKLFEEKYLEELLRKEKYRYILDRACMQFEPNDPEYIRVSHRTYECVNEKKDFDALRSTRHFGPMAFYLAWFNNIDHLLVDMIQRDMLSEAGDLVKLYEIIHKESESAKENQNVTDDLKRLKNFYRTSSRGTTELELAIQIFEDSLLSSAKEGVV